MALIKCKECGKEVSNKAKTCPYCGRLNPKQYVWVWALFWLGFFILIILQISVPVEASKKQSTPKKSSQQASKVGIREDVSYEIIDSRISNRSWLIAVRLNKRVSKQTLRDITLKLMDVPGKQDYGRQTILYLLPGVENDFAAGFKNWAVADLHWWDPSKKPELELIINGFTAEEEEKILAEPIPKNSEIVGSWLLEDRSTCITFYRNEGKLFKEEKYGKKDGYLINIEEMAESESLMGRRFDEMEGYDSKEYLVLGPDGILRGFDEGEISFAIYRPIQRRIALQSSNQHLKPHAKGADKYWIKVTPTVTGPLSVDVMLQTNIPGSVNCELRLALTGQPPHNKTFIGTDIEVQIINGKGSATIDGTQDVTPQGFQLPFGNYIVHAGLYDDDTTKPTLFEKLGIEDGIESKSNVFTMGVPGVTVGSVVMAAKGKRWVMVREGTKGSWNPELLESKFGPLQELEPKRYLSHKIYYLKTIDMTLFVDIKNQEIRGYKDGIAYEP